MKMDVPALRWREPRRRMPRPGIIMAIVALAILLALSAVMLLRAQSEQARPKPAPAATMPLPAVLAQPNAFKPLTVEQSTLR